MRVKHTTELVLRKIDEFHCDSCGTVVKVGDVATFALATGAGYCGPACAAAGQKRDCVGAARVAFYGTEED